MKRFIRFLAIASLLAFPTFALAAPNVGSDDGSYYPTFEQTDGDYDAVRGNPQIQTLGATGIGDTFVTLQAFYDSAGSDYNADAQPRLFIEWGPGNDRDQVTIATRQNQGSRTMMFTLTGLQPSTEYSYRAVLLYDGNTERGEIRTFTTLARGQAPTRQTVQDDRITFFDKLGNLLGTGTLGSGPGSSVRSGSPSTVTSGNLTLSIDPASAILIQGEQTSYEVIARNAGSSIIRGAELEVFLPREAKYDTASAGTYDRSLHIAKVRMGAIAPGASETARIVVRGDVGDDGSEVVTRATLSYRVNSTERSVTASTKQEFDGKSSSALGASAFGAGFLPQTLIGWIFILALIMLIIFVVRRYQKANEGNK